MPASQPKRVAIIQARTSSSRLPGKVLLPILERPMIVFMAERLGSAKRIDQVVVATSNDASDDPLAAQLARHGIACVRGSLNDVLDRFHRAALETQADHVVRLTGDCPLMDADLVDHALALLAAGDIDYVANTLPPAFPDGLDVEAFTFAALDQAWKNATLRSEREHVTPYMRTPASGLRIGSWTGLVDASALRWTVDHADDYEHVLALVRAVGAARPDGFDRFDLYRATERAGLAIGADHERNAGYRQSLESDGVATPPLSSVDEHRRP
jgi:spore coat polysaccharide biosynthesis protein SpsF